MVKLAPLLVVVGVRYRKLLLALFPSAVWGSRLVGCVMLGP